MHIHLCSQYLYAAYFHTLNVLVISLPYLPTFLQLSPQDTEAYIEYLVTIDHLDEAAVKLAQIINDETFVSKDGKSKHQVRQKARQGVNQETYPSFSRFLTFFPLSFTQRFCFTSCLLIANKTLLPHLGSVVLGFIMNACIWTFYKQKRLFFSGFHLFL